MVKPLIKKGLEYVVDTLGNKIGALPSTTKSLAEYSDIIEQGVRLDTADAYKNLFHVDTEFAKGYGGELKSGSLKYGSDNMPPSLTDKELIDAQNEIKGLTQDYLKDLPDDLTVYRYGGLDNETGVSSFTLNPNYSVDSNLPWQKRLQSPMQTFKVKKEDVLASPDINSFFGGGRGFDEQEIIISNDKVGALPDTSYRIQHTPNPEGARLDDMTGGGEIFPDDIYSSQGLRYYGNPNNISDRESFEIIQKVRGDPDAEVVIYRAVPNQDSIDTINSGDFVTLSRDYAESHGQSGYGIDGQEAGKILTQKVKVKDLFSEGNDLNEFGYFPQE